MGFGYRPPTLGPFDEVFHDAKEGALTWPVRDRYGLVTLNQWCRLLGDDFIALIRRGPAEAKRVLALADRLTQREGDKNAGQRRPWLIVPSDPDDYTSL
ncbi:MAG TPA: hypothetical protein VL287_01375 [Gemmatimonadales bacterium]|nr:hypothetical protein [Gemmatimonadales bacterium]